MTFSKRLANWLELWLWDGVPATLPTNQPNSMPWNCCAATLDWQCRIML